MTTSFRTISLIFIVLSSVAVGSGCAHEPDVMFRMDAFRTPVGYDYVAWTSRGLVVDGSLLAIAGTGCLPVEGWPQVILDLPDEPRGFWLLGTRPTMSGDELGPDADEVLVNCFVELEGETRPGTERLGAFAQDADPDDNFGSGLLTWRQRAQAPAIEVLTPAGLMIPLSSRHQRCWFTTTMESGYSVCLSDESGTPVGGIEVSRWEERPDGVQGQPIATLGLPDVAISESRIWLGDSGQFLMSVGSMAAGDSRVLVAFGETVRWRTPMEGIAVPGTITSVVFDGTDAYVLSRGFGNGEVGVYRIEGGERFVRIELPEKADPTELHLSKDGTLWGTSYGAGWKLHRTPSRD